MRYLHTLFLTAALASAITAMAVPAHRVKQIKTQPDGTVVTLTLVGDEYASYYLTEDDQVVVKSNGAYYFAEPTEAGLVASPYLATDEAARTSAQKQFLQTVTPQSVDLSVQAMRMASPLMAQPAEMAPYRASASSGIGKFPNCNFPTRGTIKAIAVLVEYTDVKFKNEDPEVTKEYFTNLLNQEGFNKNGSIGSARDYFMDASNGQFTPDFDVYGPITLSREREYYGGNSGSSHNIRGYRMVMEAVDQLVAQGVSFAQYDNDNDGIVDNVYIFFAEKGEADGGAEESVWPHSSDLTRMVPSLTKGYTVQGQGLYVNHYACSAELRSNGTYSGIGTFCHEFSHVMGLPDLYNTSNSSVNYTPGVWDLMDSGSYNGPSNYPGAVPPTYSAFERNAMGWLDVEEITGPHNIELSHIIDSNKAYLISAGNVNEFFLFENRQRQGWDKYIYGHGMLVWHIQYNTTMWAVNQVNNTSSHQYVDIEEASGVISSLASGQTKYPFPGTGAKTEFTDDTTPSMRAWDGSALGLPITEITETKVDDKYFITAKVAGGSSAKSITIDELGVKVADRTIQAPEDAQVVDMMGRVVGRGTVQVPASGIYIVTVGGQAVKVAVK